MILCKSCHVFVLTSRHFLYKQTVRSESCGMLNWKQNVITWKSFWASGTLLLSCLAERPKARLARTGTFWKDKQRGSSIWKTKLLGGRLFSVLFSASMSISCFTVKNLSAGPRLIFQPTGLVTLESSRKQQSATNMPESRPLSFSYQTFYWNFSPVIYSLRDFRSCSAAFRPLFWILSRFKEVFYLIKKKYVL